MRVITLGLMLLTSLASAAVSQTKPTSVTVGAYINDIQNLELKSHSYAVDIYLWFRWKAKELDPATSMEFVNPFELWGHIKTMEYPKPHRLSSGENYQIVRNLGRFSTKLALYEYPFDHQKLVLELEDASLGLDDLHYVIAEEGVSINPDLLIPGFKIGRPTMRVLEHTYPTRFGDTDTNGPHRSSRVQIDVPVERPWFPYGIKLLVPVLCVVVTAGLMFFFSPSFVDARVDIGITALLTIVALQITLNEDLPEVDYLVLMDKVYLASYFFVIASLAVVVKTTRQFELGSHAQAAAWNRQALTVLSALYLAAISALIVFR